MSNKLKLFLGISYLIILFGFLLFLFLKLDFGRLNDFTYYKELQLMIEESVGNNFQLNLLYFFIFSVIWIILLGFGSPLLLLSGILFGKWIGFSISLISISLGTLILYSITDFFFRDLVKNNLEKRFYQYISIIKKNEFFYFFIFRFFGGLGVPFALQNTLPVIFNMKKTNYFFASFLGFIPHFFIWNSLGAGLNNYILASESFNFFNLLFTPEIYIPIIFFIILVLISFILKKKFFNNDNK